MVHHPIRASDNDDDDEGEEVRRGKKRTGARFNVGDIFCFPALDRCHFAVALGETKWGRNKNRRFSTALVEPSARGYSRADDWTGLVPVRETGSCLYTNRHFFNATSRPQQGVTRQSYRLH